jgi:hypothetical protein
MNPSKCIRLMRHTDKTTARLVLWLWLGGGRWKYSVDSFVVTYGWGDFL